MPSKFKGRLGWASEQSFVDIEQNMNTPDIRPPCQTLFPAVHVSPTPFQNACMLKYWVRTRHRRTLTSTIIPFTSQGEWTAVDGKGSRRREGDMVPPPPHPPPPPSLHPSLSFRLEFHFARMLRSIFSDTHFMKGRRHHLYCCSRCRKGRKKGKGVVRGERRRGGGGRVSVTSVTLPSPWKIQRLIALFVRLRPLSIRTKGAMIRNVWLCMKYSAALANYHFWSCVLLCLESVDIFVRLLCYSYSLGWIFCHEYYPSARL